MASLERKRKKQTEYFFKFYSKSAHCRVGLIGGLFICIKAERSVRRRLSNNKSVVFLCSLLLLLL